MEQGRDYFNKSNIDFTKFCEPLSNPQKDRIYTYETEVTNNLKEKFNEFTSIETKVCRNKIFHSAHKYQVPVFQQNKSTQLSNTSYQDFYRTHHKFVKPYGEHTKYIDNLNKNKTILRRCNFDIPVTIDIHPNQTKPKTSGALKYRRTLSRYDKHQTTAISPPKKQEMFDKTIQNQYLVFRKLFDKQRSLPSDKIELNNSINRLLAAEMINLHINSTLGKGRSKTIEV